MGDRLIEYLVWGILLLFSVKGCFKGLIREVCSLLGLVVGGWGAFRFSPSLALLMKPLLPLPHGISIALSFILILVASGILAWFVGHLLTVIFKLVLLGGINRAGGALFGLLEGALLLSLLLGVGSAPPAPETVRRKVEGSAAARPFVNCGRELLAGWRRGRQ